MCLCFFVANPFPHLSDFFFKTLNFAAAIALSERIKPLPELQWLKYYQEVQVCDATTA